MRNGQWVPLSTELTHTAEGEIAAVDHPLELVFAPSADADAIVEVDNADYALALSLVGAEPAPGDDVDATASVADGAAVRYAGAADRSDLVFQVARQARYQTIESISTPSVPLSYEWRIESPGLNVAEYGSGEVLFVDPAGEVVFVLPARAMWDVLGGEEGGIAGSASTPVAYTLDQTASGARTLVLEPNAEWLSDLDRVYPVSIDPDIYPGAGMVATYEEGSWTLNRLRFLAASMRVPARVVLVVSVDPCHGDPLDVSRRLDH